MKNRIIFLIVLFYILNTNFLSAQINLAISKFQGSGISESDIDIITDRLRIELFQFKKFRIVEREMMNEILKEALELRPIQKIDLIDKLLSSLDKPDKEIDALRAEEAENRIDAYEQGKIRAIDLKEVLEKYS